MNLLLTTFPDDPAEQAGWLEQHLLGLDLAGIVSELKALGGRRTEEVTLEEVFGDLLPRVLEEGLTVLSPKQLRVLLKNPELLIQLQTRIFLDGGEHWNNLPQPEPEMQGRIERGRARLQQYVSQSATTAPAAGTIPMSSRSGVAWYRHPVVVSLATAAVVLIAVFVGRPLPTTVKQPVAQGWGWSKPGALDDSLPAKDYLVKLSESAHDWFNKTPGTPEALARRILEFRQGCSTLILSEHKPLKPEDKAWLVERCQAWAKKLDQHLADIEAGKDLLQVRGEADETVNKLMKAIRDRADKV